MLILRGPRADSPDALTCLGSDLILFLFPAWHRCHWTGAGIWWFAAALASVGRQSVVSPSKVASHKVADDFASGVSSQLLQGHHPLLLMATGGPSLSGVAHGFMQTVPEAE